MTDFDKVGEFHKKFDLPISKNTGELPSTEILLFRLQFLQEELMELTRAIRERDVIEIGDALCDLIYVAHGTAHLANLPMQDMFDEVHRSNMEKEKSTLKNPSKRGMTGFDIVKPVFWRAPDLKSVLLKHNPDAHDD